MTGMFRLSVWHPATEPASATPIAIRRQFIRLIGRLLCASHSSEQRLVPIRVLIYVGSRQYDQIETRICVRDGERAWRSRRREGIAFCKVPGGDPTQDDLDRLCFRAFKGLVVERTAPVEGRHLMRGVGVLLRRRPDHVEKELRLD